MTDDMGKRGFMVTLIKYPETLFGTDPTLIMAHREKNEGLE